MDIHGYNKEADDIDEIQAEDRQERMKKEKAKRSHNNYVRWKKDKGEWCYKHSCEYQKDDGCPICNRLDSANHGKANIGGTNGN